MLLVGWEADRCERLASSSTAAVDRARLVLDLVALEDVSCMAQQPIGGTDPVQRWRMLEAIVLEGDLDDLGGNREIVQLACDQLDVTGCGSPVRWQS